MEHSTDHDLEQLERNIALMRAVGRTHMPVPLTTIEKFIAAMRGGDRANECVTGAKRGAAA